MFAVLAVVVEWRGPSVVVVSGRGLLRPSRRVVTCCDYTRASAMSRLPGRRTHFMSTSSHETLGHLLGFDKDKLPSREALMRYADSLHAAGHPIANAWPLLMTRIAR